MNKELDRFLETNLVNCSNFTDFIEALELIATVKTLEGCHNPLSIGKSKAERSKEEILYVIIADFPTIMTGKDQNHVVSGIMFDVNCLELDEYRAMKEFENKLIEFNNDITYTKPNHTNGKWVIKFNNPFALFALYVLFDEIHLKHPIFFW